MKKKTVALLLCMMTAFTAIGCGNSNSDETPETTEAVEGTETAGTASLPTVDLGKYELNAAELVTLCDYSAIPVTITGDYEIDEADVTDYFTQLFSYYGPFYTADDTKTTIAEGDIVNVDYVGTLDGVAFDNGSAENQNIDVTNNSSATGSAYIEGFTEGLMGASVGDVIDCDVTFPDGYFNTDLAGKAVVFTFTVNSIQKEMTIDTIDDTFASEQFGVDTVEEMYAEIQSYLESSAESTKANDTYTAIQTYLLDNCTVEIPEDYFADRFTAFENMFITTYCSGDASQLEDYLSSNYGYTVEQAEAEWTTSLQENIKLELIMEVIAANEGIEFDQEGYDTYVSSMVSYGGFGDETAMYANYGYGDATYGEAYMKRIYVANQGLDNVRENAVVTVESASSDVAAVEGTEEVENTETVSE